MTNKTQLINFEGKEYEIDARARFVARDSNGTIWAYEGKPAWNDWRGQWGICNWRFTLVQANW
ncbi:hypothetical protein O157vBn_00096 [Escherichia phage vB_Eco4M-7n]|nr:hypothetical protein vBEco4M7_14 [Escherichia phage vB_Eco4M-7]